MKFLDLADKLCILVYILLPHSIHWLQLLDVGLFSLLSIAYSKALNRLIYKSESLVSMTKRIFYRIFKEAFLIAFTKRNIEHAFAKLGIWPYNPEVLISILRKPIVKPIDLDPTRL
jgi:hypothetical protein